MQADNVIVQVITDAIDRTSIFETRTDASKITVFYKQAIAYAQGINGALVYIHFDDLAMGKVAIKKEVFFALPDHRREFDLTVYSDELLIRSINELVNTGRRS